MKISQINLIKYKIFLLISLIGSYGYTDGLQVTSISGPVTTGNGTTKPQNVQSGQTVTTDINNNIVVTSVLGTYETFQKSEMAASTAAANLKAVQNKILAIQNDKKLSPIEQKKQVDAIRKEETAAIEEVKTAEAAKQAANEMLKKTVDANFYTSELNKAAAANNAKLELLKAKVEAAKIQAEADKKAVADTALKPLTAQQQQDLDAEIKKAIAQAKTDAADEYYPGYEPTFIFNGSQAAMEAYNKEFKSEFDRIERQKQVVMADYKANVKKEEEDLKLKEQIVGNKVIDLKNEVEKLQAGKADQSVILDAYSKYYDATIEATNARQAVIDFAGGKGSRIDKPNIIFRSSPTIINNVTTSQADLEAQAANKAAIEKAKKSASELKNAQNELANTEKSQKNEQKALDEVAAKIKNDANAIAEAKEILKNEEKKLALENEKLKKLKEDLKTFQEKTAAAEAIQKKAADEKLKADQAWAAIQNNKKPNEKIFATQKEIDDDKKKEDQALEKKHQADLAEFNKNLAANEKIRNAYVRSMENKETAEDKKITQKEKEEWFVKHKANLEASDKSMKSSVRESNSRSGLDRMGDAYNEMIYNLKLITIPPRPPEKPKAKPVIYTLVTDPRIAADEALKIANKKVEDTKSVDFFAAQSKADAQQKVLDAQKATLQKAITFVVAIAAAKRTIIVRNPTPILDKPIPDGTELVIKVVQKTKSFNSTNTNKNVGIKLDALADASPAKNLLNLTSKKQ
jgi:hypothetical protein